MKRRDLFDAGYFAPNDPKGEEDIHEDYQGEDDGFWAISRGLGCPRCDYHYVERTPSRHYGYEDCSCWNCGLSWVEHVGEDEEEDNE